MQKLQKMAEPSRLIILRATQKIQNLEEDNALLQKELRRLSDIELKYQLLQKDYERLKLARAFGPSEEDKKKAYRRLTNMIERIDNCLNIIRNQ